MSGNKLEVKDIFFDLDRTLWDYEKCSFETLVDLFLQYKLEEKGIPGLDIFIKRYKLRNENLWTQLGKGKINRQELRDFRFLYTFHDFGIMDQHLIDSFSLDYLEICPTKGHLNENALEMLIQLMEHFNLHIITNGFREAQFTKIKYSGIFDHFQTIVTPEDAGCMKPHSAIFEFSLKQSGAELEKSLYVGDNYDIDICGARNAGMHQAWYNPAKRHRPIPPTINLACLSELKDHLQIPVFSPANERSCQ